jgi:hypothetical protein
MNLKIQKINSHMPLYFLLLLKESPKTKLFILFHNFKTDPNFPILTLNYLYIHFQNMMHPHYANIRSFFFSMAYYIYYQYNPKLMLIITL